MYFVAAVLAVLSGLFYAAGHHEIGSLAPMLRDTVAHFATVQSTSWPALLLQAVWGALSAYADALAWRLPEGLNARRAGVWPLSRLSIGPIGTASFHPHPDR